MPPKKNGLGRGLSEIFMQNESEDHNDTITLKISEIEPNKNQPRREFEPEALNELSESIAQHGVLQPLVVRPIFGGGYEIVAGERRFRAARMAGLNEVPVVVRELTDSEAMELALVENLQREDLSDLELAMGYDSLMKEYSMTQEQIAGIVNKSRSAVANTLRLLKLPESIKIMLKNSDITSGHARALLGLEKEDMLETAAKTIIDNNLSVRETEKMVAQLNKEVWLPPSMALFRFPAMLLPTRRSNSQSRPNRATDSAQ